MFVIHQSVLISSPVIKVYNNHAMERRIGDRRVEEHV